MDPRLVGILHALEALPQDEEVAHDVSSSVVERLGGEPHGTDQFGVIRNRDSRALRCLVERETARQEARITTGAKRVHGDAHEVVVYRGGSAARQGDRDRVGIGDVADDGVKAARGDAAGLERGVDDRLIGVDRARETRRQIVDLDAREVCPASAAAMMVPVPQPGSSTSEVPEAPTPSVASARTMALATGLGV